MMKFLKTGWYKPDSTLPFYAEVVLGKLNNAQEIATKLEDALYMAMKNVDGKDLTTAINPIFTVRDGDIIMGSRIPIPLRGSDFGFFKTHLQFP